MAKRKTAREKLNCQNDLPKIKAAPDNWGGGTMLIAHPTEINALMKQIPAGQVTTSEHIRAQLAHAHNASICCPMTAGIFINVSAAAAEEDKADGLSEFTPYWRTLKKNGELNAKYPGGIEKHRSFLEAEGHTVRQKGKRFFVVDYEQRLFRGLD